MEAWRVALAALNVVQLALLCLLTWERAKAPRISRRRRWQRR